MDFLDSLDLNSHLHNDDKTERMRSWYLFEQYKSLERNQLDATQKLKNRSLEERLLHRELTERRARRRLYNDETTQSRTQLKVHRPDRCFSTATDDIYESYCELQDFESAEFDDQSRDSAFMEDFKVLEESMDGTSCADCVYAADDLSDKVDSKNSQFAIADTTQSTQKTIAESIQRHLETVKQNMASLEMFARMDDGHVLYGDAAKSADGPKLGEVNSKNVKNVLCENQLFCLWSRFVIFAYQIIQLNHGNCYFDYSSQLLTAVLACDALCRGINRVCDILQSYVSPVKYASDHSEAGSVNKCLKKRKKCACKRVRNSSKHKINSCCYKTYTAKKILASAHLGNACCRRKCLVKNIIEENTTGRLTSPTRCRHHADLASTCPTLWPELRARRRAVDDRMLRLVRQLDDALTSDVDDFRDDIIF